MTMQQTRQVYMFDKYRPILRSDWTAKCLEAVKLHQTIFPASEEVLTSTVCITNCIDPQFVADVQCSSGIRTAQLS